MYVAMLLTDWYATFPPFLYFYSTHLSRNVVSNKPIDGPVNPDMDVYIGRSETAMWMRVVSSWVCMLLYAWSLLAPVVMPDR